MGLIMNMVTLIICDTYPTGFDLKGSDGDVWDETFELELVKE